MKKILCFIILWLVFIPKAQAHDWVMVNAYGAGSAYSAGQTKYNPPCGFPQGNTTEANAQIRVQDSYAWKNLYVRVTANATTGGTTTVRSRINGNYGNQSVSIAASQTGFFWDNTNSDTLVPGDLICYETMTGSGGSVTFTIFGASVLSSYTSKAPILIAHHNFSASANANVFSVIIGRYFTSATESDAQYTFRTPAVLTNFQARVGTNTRSDATTLRIRINGDNGSQSVSVPASTTGFFEDTVNTDVISSGNKVCHQIVTGAGTGSITISSISIRSVSDAMQVGAATIWTTTLSSNLTRYLTIGGDAQGFNATEANVEMYALADFRARNMFVNVPTNSINGSTTFRLRKNRTNGNLVVTVPASATGTFEDNTNVDSFIVTDTINFSIVSGGSSGSMLIYYVAFEEIQARRTIIMMD